MSLQTRLSALITTIKGAVAALDVRVTALEGAGGGGGGSIFPIWAEESAALASNAYEWSWGNGATGSDIGIPVPMACELFAVSFNADVAGTSLTMITERNAVAAYTSTHPGQNSVDTLATPVAFAAGDVVAFRTGTVTGSYSDARVCAWFREI